MPIKVGKVGTYKDDAAEETLKAEGFTNLYSVLDDMQNVPKLMADRINLWIVGELQGIQGQGKGCERPVGKTL